MINDKKEFQQLMKGWVASGKSRNSLARSFSTEMTSLARDVAPFDQVLAKKMEAVSKGFDDAAAAIDAIDSYLATKNEGKDGSQR